VVIFVAHKQLINPFAENYYFTEMCSGSEAGSYLRPVDFVYHSTLGLRVIKKKEEERGSRAARLIERKCVRETTH